MIDQRWRYLSVEADEFGMRRKFMSTQDEIRRASTDFYAALTRMAAGHEGTMASIWPHNILVTAMHPIGGRDEGWDAVSSSFDQVAKAATGGKISLHDQLIRVIGDVAYEIGSEKGSFTFAGRTVDIDQRVTNIYRKQDGEWKVIHHHSDMSPAMIEIVKSL
jgi:ketosteroid isomerase-like protein